jgi:hypothetical protein
LVKTSYHFGLSSDFDEKDMNSQPDIEKPMPYLMKSLEE